MCAGAWYGAFVGAPVARSRRSRSLRSRLPEGGATRPYPRTPTRGKLSLQAVFFCALRARVRFAQVFCADARSRTPCALRAVFVLSQGGVDAVADG